MSRTAPSLRDPRPSAEGVCLNGQVQAQIEELPENRVRLTVQVPSHDVHHAIEHAATDLAQTAKIPGFRKGKVPRQVLVQKVGKERLMTEAIESHIGGWFWNAAARTRVRPIAQPEYEFELPTADDVDWEFSATFPVPTKPELPDWTTLEVGAIEPEVPEELVQQELDALRSTVAELVPVEGRPVGPDDTVILDLVSPGGETRRDYVVELGRGAVVEEVEHGVVGLKAGETKEIEFELADDAKQAVGVTVKEIKEKVLPELDDELARSASEFETLAELRAEIESRLGAQIAEEVEAQFRSDVVDALVNASKLDASAGPLVEARTRELLRGLARQVEARGVPLDTYLAMTGQQPEQLLARLGDEAARSVARELVLDAVAEQLDIQVPDEEIEALVREQGSELGDDVDETLLRLRETGRFEALRDDIRLRNALDRVAGEVKRIPRELAEVREAIWTPDKEKQQTDAKLWTPGSEGAT
jgi:trigger factor